MLRVGTGRSLVTFVRAGFLERWRQMTDGRVLRREWEVRRGGGKPRHHGKEQERKCSGGKGKRNQEKVVFRMGQRDCKTLGGGEWGEHPLKIGEKKYFNEQGSGRSWAGRNGLKFENGFKKQQGLFL